MNTLFIQVRGNEKPIQLICDKAEENNETRELLAYRGNQVIGHFNLQDIVGWWIGG